MPLLRRSTSAWMQRDAASRSGVPEGEQCSGPTYRSNAEKSGEICGLGMAIGQHGIGDFDESRDVGTGKIVNPIIFLAKLDTAVMDFQHDILQ